MNYMEKIKQLVREGRENETAEVLDEGMKAIGREVVGLVNWHPGDWPIVIAVLRLVAESMENSLHAENRALLALLNAAFTAEAKITHTTIDEAELRRQMEEEKQ